MVANMYGWSCVTKEKNTFLSQECGTVSIVTVPEKTFITFQG